MKCLVLLRFPPNGICRALGKPGKPHLTLLPRREHSYDVIVRLLKHVVCVHALII